MKEIVTKKGTAIGNMRFDSIKVRSDWKNEPTAKEARQRLIDGEAMGEAVEDQQKQISDKHGTGGSLTDTLVKELGGGKMAENQTNACKNLINNIKAGGGTGELDGDLAAAARKRMIDRQGSNGGHPNTRKDGVNKSPRNYAEARESARAWANAGSR